MPRQHLKVNKTYRSVLGDVNQNSDSITWVRDNEHNYGYDPGLRKLQGPRFSNWKIVFNESADKYPPVPDETPCGCEEVASCWHSVPLRRNLFSDQPAHTGKPNNVVTQTPTVKMCDQAVQTDIDYFHAKDLWTTGYASRLSEVIDSETSTGNRDPLHNLLENGFWDLSKSAQDNNK